MSCGATAGDFFEEVAEEVWEGVGGGEGAMDVVPFVVDRKSTRLNSSHSS